MSRIPMTAESDCKACRGLGFITREVYRDPMTMRIGGPPQHVPTQRVLCSCVRAEEPETTKATRARLGWPPLTDEQKAENLESNEP